MKLAVFFRYHAASPTFFGLWELKPDDEIDDVKGLIWGLYHDVFERGYTVVYSDFEERMLEEGHAKIDSNAVIAEHCLVLETGEEEIWAEEKRHDEEERARLARRTPEEVKRDEERWSAFLQEPLEFCEEEDRKQDEAE